MVKQIEQGQLTRRSILSSAGVLFSRLSGVVRSVALSASFGAGVVLDSFFVALRLPSSLRDLLADGALSSATTTVLARIPDDSPEFRRVFFEIALTFFLVTLFLAGVGAWTAEEIVRGLADPHYPEEGLLQAAAALKWMVFYLPLAMWSALCVSVLSIRGQLFLSTASSGLFNLGIIGGALLIARSESLTSAGFFPAEGIAWGTLLGGVGQCILLARPLVKDGTVSMSGLCLGLRFWKSSDVAEVFRLILPRTLGQGALILGMLLSTHYATSLGPGAVTLLTNTLILILVPVGLFGVAGGYAALPLFAKSRQRGARAEFWAAVEESRDLVSFLGAAASSGLAVAALPLCTVLFRYGGFTADDTFRNAAALVGFSFTIWFSAQTKVLTQALYALDRTRRVAIHAAVYVGVLALGLPFFTEAFGLMGMGLAGLCAAGTEWVLNVHLLRSAARTDGMDADVFPWLTPQQGLIASVALSAFFLCFGFYRLDWVDQIAISEGWNHLSAWLSLCALGAVWAVIWGVLLSCIGPAELRRQLMRRLGRAGMKNQKS